MKENKRRVAVIKVHIRTHYTDDHDLHTSLSAAIDDLEFQDITQEEHEILCTSLYLLDDKAKWNDETKYLLIEKVDSKICLDSILGQLEEFKRKDLERREKKERSKLLVEERKKKKAQKEKEKLYEQLKAEMENKNT